MLFDFDEDYGLAEKIVDYVIKMKCDNGLPILPSTKSVKSQKSYVEACKMLWAIYDGTFFKTYSFETRSDYNMDGWKDKIKECENDWGKVRSLVLGSVRHFYKSLYPEYSPQNKNYLKTIKFSNFFRTGFNQSMFVNCINEPLESNAFLRNKKTENIKKNIPDKYIGIAEKFYNKHIVDSVYANVYWEGVSNICKWWKLFNTYTKYGFDVKGNLEDGNIIKDFCKYVADYINRSDKDCNPYWFRIYDMNDSVICDGMFRRYLSTDRFTVCNDLPNRLWTYGNEDKFKTLIKKSNPIIKVVEDEKSFIDNLED